MSSSAHARPGPPHADVTWVVALLPDGDGRPRVVHPHGVSPLPDPSCPVMLCGTHRLNDNVVTWAFGYVTADRPTPSVWFLTRHGWRAHPGAVRRLTSTTWAAQLGGRWTRVRVV